MHLVALALVACTSPVVHPETGTTDTGPDITVGAPVSDVESDEHRDVETMVEVTWTQRQFADAAWLEVTDIDGRVHETPHLANVAPGEHTQFILGTPPGERVEYRIYNEIDGELHVSDEVFTARVGSAYGGLPLPEVVTWEPTLASEHPYWLVSVDITDEGYYYDGPFWLFIVDRQGRVVWYWEVPKERSSMFPRVSREGHHLVFDANTTYSKWDHGAESSFHRLSLDLSWHLEVAAPYHTYAWDEDSVGNLLFDAVDPLDEDVYTLERLTPDGTRATLWRCNDDAMMPDQLESGDCGCNSVRWDETRDTVLWSMYASDTVAEVDHRAGQAVHLWGDLNPVWSFDPPQAAFDSPHFPGFTPEGHVLVFTDVPGTEHTVQRVREFEVDESSEVLRQVWSFGAGQTGYAYYAGEADRLSNGNTTIVYGTDGMLREVTPAGEVAWEMHWPSNLLVGHVEPIDDLYALSRGPVP